MPKYNVTVKVIATTEYTVVIEASSEQLALNEACSRSVYAASTPDDFQVDTGYCEFEPEAEQLTAICPDCDVEHAVATAKDSGNIIVDGKIVPDPARAWWDADQEYCASCGVIGDALDAAENEANKTKPTLST
jgi:hypothetical protein